jgi:hypothetical protein
MNLLRIIRFIPIISILLFIVVVTILGFVTPGYDPLAHTISRLALTKYGYIAELNLIQLGIGSLILGIELASMVQTKKRYVEILPFFLVATGSLFGAALARTDFIDHPRQLISMSMMAKMHFVAVAGFIALCPITVFTLIHAFSADPTWRTLTKITVVMASVSFILSLLFFLLFVLGWFLPYRGLFQKGIVLWTLGWTMLIAIKAAREK